MNKFLAALCLFLSPMAIAQPFPNDRDVIAVYCLEVYGALDEIFSGFAQSGSGNAESIPAIKEMAVLKDRTLQYLTRRSQFLTEADYRAFSPIKEATAVIAQQDIHQFIRDTIACAKARQTNSSAQCRNSEAKTMIRQCRDPQFVQAAFGD